MDEHEKIELLDEGYIHVRIIIEVIGKPKEYVEDAMQTHLKKIHEDKYKILLEDTHTPEEQDGLFATFTEMEILFKNTDSLLGFCFDFMPSSVEIIEPEVLEVKSHDLTHLLNDLQNRLHALNNGILQLRDTNKHYVKNTAVLLRNFIVVLVSSKPMDIDKMSKYLGMKNEEVQKVLDVLIKEEKIVKEGDIYKAVTHG